MKKALVPIAAVVLLGLAAIPLLSKPEPERIPPGVERLRGTPDWFTGPLSRISIPGVEVQLQGKGAPRLVLGVAVDCHAGLDAKLAPVADAAALQRARDALMADLLTLTPEQVGESSPERYALKRRALPLLERALFPDGSARIQRVHFEKLLFAGGS